jgi:hypothetical protein
VIGLSAGCWGGAAGGPGPPDGHQQRAEAEDHRGEPHQATEDGDQGQDPQDAPADQEGKGPGGRLTQDPPADDPGGGPVPERIDQPQGRQQAEAERDPDQGDQGDDGQVEGSTLTTTLPIFRPVST